MPHLTRRHFLATSTALAAAAAVTPVIVRAAGATPGPGELAMHAATPNPEGVFERLFLLKGDPLAEPIHTILTEDGSAAPARWTPARAGCCG